MSKKKQKNNNR